MSPHRGPYRFGLWPAGFWGPKPGLLPRRRRRTCRYAIMGLGAVCHTLNPRLFEADLEYIINHAQARQCQSDSSGRPSS